MNKIYFIALSLILLPCKEIYSQHTFVWIESFKVFREAIYRGDKNNVKAFMDFPILNVNNEIWYLVYEGNENALSMLSDKTKPFNEKDFDRYSDKLFPSTFIKAILKIKTNELYKDGQYETTNLKEGSITYKLFATFNSKEHLLTLHMAYYNSIKEKDENGKEINEPAEYSVIYDFVVLKNGQLKFNQLMLAG